MSENVTCIFSANPEEGNDFLIAYWWILITSLIHGVGFVMVIYSTVEFVIAQTPCQMKGLSVSLLIKSLEVFTIPGELIIKIFTWFPFEIFPSYGFYYHMTLLVNMLAILLLFVVISK